ncbi:hypothetical protein C7S20_14090 [Christiangramia fulva]|uniref:DUF3817 domain-containing protein n=1 Tax=Christiangramia fulva TaxID=2126553 RepID=A0A2R3Z7N3_9FLAO|nr:DUF3817 domain-containing protein [Christiangramia fulva]AVR46303.1 hypothetical protein C7S20_14090 [Christiangramia fulva]
MSLEKQLTLFKWISILEGISFLLLLGIAMPLKYILDMPQMVQQVGMIHGVLFIGYVLGGFLLKQPMNWNRRQVLTVLGCSLIPFGPFYVERKYL